ncbi:hypothetical protein EON65_55795 [archaeon]|nr:MAG: hypothetical protein EON65_55795 [archaeon]
MRAPVRPVSPHTPLLRLYGPAAPAAPQHLRPLRGWGGLLQQRIQGTRLLPYMQKMSGVCLEYRYGYGYGLAGIVYGVWNHNRYGLGRGYGVWNAVTVVCMRGVWV